MTDERFEELKKHMECIPLYAGEPITKPPLEPKYRGAITVYECGSFTAIASRHANKNFGVQCWLVDMLCGENESGWHTFRDTRAEAEAAAAAWCQQGGE